MDAMTFSMSLRLPTPVAIRIIIVIAILFGGATTAPYFM
jgi:hypothetical protein